MTDADADPDLEAKLEHIHMTFDSMQRLANDLAVAGRELAKTMQQLDRYMERAEGEIVNWAAAKDQPTETVAARSAVAE